MSDWDIVKMIPKLVLVAFGIGLGIGGGALSLRDAVRFMQYIAGLGKWA